MSPASKSKSKDKKPGKEPAKGSLKPSGHVNTSGGIAASGYNPLSGTFHSFESAPGPAASSSHMSGRFRNIDDTDDHNGNSFGTGTEYDSVSNNGSWSGESEDHKEKTSQPSSRQESVPGSDSDKREKIRQKNEKKHQRQKERRAQELHERCTGYLMSRKLETLAQQLVAMGFSHERATMALILNEGRVEESVAWLFEGAEEDRLMEHNLDGGGNLKIDISEELSRITKMEIKYKASKQEVERVIVACEGDLDRAEETLKEQKKEAPAVPLKPEGNGAPPTDYIKVSKAPTPSLMRVQAKPSASTIQQNGDEKDFNYNKASTTALASSLDSSSKSIQVLKKIPPKGEWAKQQQSQQIAVPTEKRWLSAGSNPSVSFSLASPYTASPQPSALTEARLLDVENKLKNLQLGSVREPITVMQRPKSANVNQAPNPNVSSLPFGGTATGWYPNHLETLQPNSLAPPVALSRSLGPSSVINPNPMYNHNQIPFQSQQFVSGSSSLDPQGTSRNNGGLWNRGGVSPTLAPASSLGLFSGPNSSSGPPSLVDWSTDGSKSQFDYNNIDWSVEPGPLMSRPSGLWTGANYSLQNNARMNDSFAYGLGMRSTISPALSSLSGASFPGVRDEASSSDRTAGSSREWTSPFQEKDIFSLPRQYVSSPTQ